MSFEPLDEVHNVFEEIEEHVLARANSLRRPDDSSIPSLCFGSLPELPAPPALFLSAPARLLFLA